MWNIIVEYIIGPVFLAALYHPAIVSVAIITAVTAVTVREVA